MRIPRTLALGAAVLALVISACTPGESGSRGARWTAAAGTPEISIGSAGFPEAALVAEIYAQALEANGFPSIAISSSASAPRCAPRSTQERSTLLRTTLAALPPSWSWSSTSDADAVHAALLPALEELGQTAFDYSPGTDADGFAVRQETAEELGLATMSDLAEVAGDLVWGLATGCPENPICGPGLLDVYGIDISAIDVEALSPCSPEIAEALNSGAIERRPGLHDPGRDRQLQLRRAWRTIRD